MRTLIGRMLDVSPEEVSFSKLGFNGQESMRRQGELVVQLFLNGYRAAFQSDDPDALAARLESVQDHFRGFAYEGAGLGLTVLDLLIPWRRNRFQAFLQGPGQYHAYMMHVGAGLALGRIPIPPWILLRRLDPLFRWAAPDGFGFYEGFTHLSLAVRRQRIPRRLKGYARRVFDVGLGRSIWFTEAAEVDAVAATIGSFPSQRRADLWSGVGIACSYTGWVSRQTIEALRDTAGSYQPQLAQGAAFSARARQRARNPTAETDMACQVLWGLAAEDAAALTDAAQQDLPGDGAVPAFEVWRQRIQASFARGGPALSS
jgi:hypothetical protein